MMCEKLLKKFEVTKKDELIEALYDYQENEGQFITQEYRNTLKKFYNEREEKYDEIIKTFEKYSTNLDEIREIKDKIIKCKELYNEEASMLDYIYYNVGLKTGIKLIVESI